MIDALSCLMSQDRTSASFCHKFGWDELHGMLRPQQWSSGAGKDSGAMETWPEFWSPKGTCAVSLKSGELGQRDWQEAVLSGLDNV